MKPIFCRIRMKYLMADDIISHFPEHLIYVEPFIGGGGVYWRKNQSPGEVINDLDTQLINDYKMIKKTSPNLNNHSNHLDSIQKLNKFIKKKHTSVEDKLTDSIDVTALVECR